MSKYKRFGLQLQSLELIFVFLEILLNSKAFRFEKFKSCVDRKPWAGVNTGPSVLWNQLLPGSSFTVRQPLLYTKKLPWAAIKFLHYTFFVLFDVYMEISPRKCHLAKSGHAQKVAFPSATAISPGIKWLTAPNICSLQLTCECGWWRWRPTRLSSSTWSPWV